MRYAALFSILAAGDLFAGTAGNSDISIIYGIFMVFFAIMLGVDRFVKYMKRRRKMHEAETTELE